MRDVMTLDKMTDFSLAKTSEWWMRWSRKWMKLTPEIINDYLIIFLIIYLIRYTQLVRHSIIYLHMHNPLLVSPF